jgi:membrane protease subunit HflC
MKNKPLLFSSILVVVVFVLLQLLVIVRQGEVGVLTSLGKAVKQYDEPGMYVKWPRPIQRVYKLDNRLHTQETTFGETLTRDGINILVSVYAGWRVTEPQKFLERVDFDVETAERNLDGLIRDRQKAVIGKYAFTDLFNVEADKVQLEAIENEMLAEVKAVALERYGVEIEMIGIHRIGLPESITTSVFERMMAERKRLSDQYRAEGEAKATEIRAVADSTRDKLLSGARADAVRRRGEADAQAAKYYQVFAKNPELARDLRRLVSYEAILKENATIILGTDSEPFRVMDNKKTTP